jgi:hypothetical protein
MNADYSAGRSPVAELVSLMMEPIPTVFGRLTLLASCYHAAKDLYDVPRLTRLFGAETVDLELRQCHRRIFLQWLQLGIEEQKAEVEAYLRTAPPGVDWAEAARTAPPPDARDAERQLHLADLATLLDVMTGDRL